MIRSKKAKVIAGIAILAFIILAAITVFPGAFVFLANLLSRQNTRSSALVNDYLSGDYAAAQKDAAQYIAAYPGVNRDYVNAEYVQESSTYLAASSTSGEADAVQLVLKRYNDPSAPPFDRVEALNRILLDLLQSGKDPAVFDAAFGNAALGRFLTVSPVVASGTAPTTQQLADADPLSSELNLADYSVTLYPTWTSYMVTGELQDAAPILKAALAGEPTTGFTTQAADLTVELAQAKKLYDIAAYRIPRYYAEAAIEPSFDYWNGLLLGASSLVDPTQLPNAEAAFNKVFASYQDSKQAPGLQQVTVSADLAYARFVSLVGGSSRDADVKARLDQLAGIITANPGGSGYFMLELQGIGKNDPTETKEFTELAAISPAFKSLLVAAGWQS